MSLNNGIIGDMLLNSSPKIKKEIWEKHGADLLKQFPQEIQEAYSFVFALGDYKALFGIDNSLLKRHIALVQACFLEASIKIMLDEIMNPIQYETELPEASSIHIPSQCKLGMIHCVKERQSEEEGFELTLFSKREPKNLIASIEHETLDEVIDSIANKEQEWREQRSMSTRDS